VGVLPARRVRSLRGLTAALGSRSRWRRLCRRWTGGSLCGLRPHWECVRSHSLCCCCFVLLNDSLLQVSSQDELGERAQRTAAVRPPATSFIMHAFLVQSLSDRVCVPQTVRRGPPQGSSGRVFTGRAGLRPQSAGAVVPRSGDGSPPSAKLDWGIWMRLMWLWRGCRGADASGSGGGAGPSGRGCVIRAAQAAQCGRPEHAAAAAHAALSVC